MTNQLSRYIIISTFLGIFNCSLQVVAEDSLLDFVPSILAGIKKLPRPIDFKVAYPAIPSGSEYMVDTSGWDDPSNGINASKTTDRLQDEIDIASDQGYRKVVIPASTYIIGKDSNDKYQSGVDLYSDTEYVLSGETIIQLVTNNKSNYCILRVGAESDVIIRGGEIIGDRDTHAFTPDPDNNTTHSEGHAICIEDSQRVHVTGMKIHSVTGDGSLLLDSTDIRYTNNRIYNNRRQGISVVGGIRVAIERNEIHNIRGASPQFGVDIEGAGREDRA